MSLSINNILQKFKIRSKNYHLYEIALTHSSYAHDKNSKEDYEKLEFLGDAVIELIVSEFLFHKYKDLDEGKLSKFRIIMVQSKTLIKASQDLGLDKLIKVGESIRKSNHISNNIIEDVFESFIGAVYLDQGIAKAKEILRRTIIHYFQIHSLNEQQDFKSLLQEYMQKYSKHDIYYKIIDNKNNQYWVEVWVNNIKYGIGCGVRIKDAEMQAAKAAYSKFVKGK